MLKAEYCGDAGGCGQFMNTDGQLEKWRSQNCTGLTCGASDRLFYGSDLQPFSDDFGQELSTDFPGVWRYLYQRSVCPYDAHRACVGSLTEDYDGPYRMVNRTVYHWVRPR